MVEAEAASQKYQALFPDVSSVSSRELLHDTFSSADDVAAAEQSNNSINWKLHGEDVLLVDVRTRSEREVSMISGAITLQEFRECILPSLLEVPNQCIQNKSTLMKNGIYQKVHKEECGNAPASLSSTYCNRPGIVALYCTIGYRSGLEARKIQKGYPYLFVQPDDDDEEEDEVQDDGMHGRIKIVNLDGIVSFANATSDISSGMQNLAIPEEGMDVQYNTPLLIEPSTKQYTNRVHVYGSSWKKYLSKEHYGAVVFSRMEFARRGLAMLGRSCCLTCGCNVCIK